MDDALIQAAARLVVEEGLDYAGAKRRAAQALDRRAARHTEWPPNEELEDAVREHIALFFADTQPAELRALREVALRWMHRLAPFRPHLAGAVWRGTATRLSPIWIDLFADDPKAPEIELINLGADADGGSLPSSRGKEDLPVLTMAERNAALQDWVTIHFVVRDLDEQRGALKPDGRGRAWRGSTASVERLLEETAP